MQIYQPGAKRRTSSSTTPDNSCENKNRVECDANTKIDNNVPSTSTSSSRGHDNRKRNDKKESAAKGQFDDNLKKSTTEKRISRYSEKRNKVKEKRDLGDNPTAIGGPTGDLS